MAGIKNEVALLSREVQKLSDAVEEKGGHSRRQEDMLKQLNSSMGSLGKEMASSNKKLEDRITQLCEEVATSAESLEDLETSVKALQEAFSPGQKKVLDARLADIREAILREMEQSVNTQLRALQEREAAQVSKAKAEIHDLRGQLELFLSIESSATARCLSCFDRRTQMQNQTVTGVDGRVYQQQRVGTPPGTGGEKLPSVQMRGSVKKGGQSQLLGSQGVRVHGSIGTIRTEDVAATKGLGRAASVGTLGVGDGHFHQPFPMGGPDP